MAAAETVIERFGTRGSTPVLYLHGVPGAAVEAQLIASAAAARNIELWAVNRAHLAPETTSAAIVDRLANAVLELGCGQRLPILGFSIGAALALRVASRLGADAGPLFLLSAAGPLDRPGAFDGMGAGARVFRSAQRNGAGFRLTVAGQAFLAAHAPGLLARLLFAGADASDRSFAGTAEGQAALKRILAGAWADGGRSYRRDLAAYVEPWSHELCRITSRVELWHGAGDTWAPPDMARGLAQDLPDARLHKAAGGHYTTLIGRAPEALTAAMG
jgi:pimeloyl-ACP methyl ester carboxylesterase